MTENHWPGAQEPVRVLRIIARLNVGGPAIHATLLTDRMNQRRYRCLLIAGTEGDKEGNYLELMGKEMPDLQVVPTLGRDIRGWSDLKTLASLVRHIRRFRPQIVHTHTAKAGTLGRIAAWLCRVPVIVHTYHGHVFHGYFSSGATKFFATVERWLAGRTDRLITVSTTVRGELLQLGIGTPEQHVVIPLGFELDRFLRADALRGELRRELEIECDELLVGIVARLVPIKAHETFLRAAAAIVAVVPRVRFLIVGDGERRQELESLTRTLGLGNRVHFLGWRADLDRVYADLDVVALTSKNEGSPVALIEAMAAGRAVVATSVGGVPDLIQHGRNGLLIPTDDPESLAAATQELLVDAARRKMLGAEGRARTREAFGADRLVADMERLYEEMLERA